MLSIKKGDKYFNKHKKNSIHVINNTTINMKKSGLVALLGPSGCGKTTLLNVIGGLDKVDSGEIFINGEKLSSKLMYKVDKLRNLNIGYIFQDYKLVDNLTVYENVAFVLKMLGITDKKEIDEKVLYVLDCVGMLRYKNRPATMLSGGEKQRVGIARALVKNPNIILADEPTGNLDSKNSLEIMKIIKAISLEKLVILVTHEQDLARFYASRIIEIQDGKIIRDYENDNVDDLDYRQDNCFYLKDFKYQNRLGDMINNINIYSDNSEKVCLDIVIKNGNIYIKNKEDDKIEVVDDYSNIEFINDSYKKISHSTEEKYDYDFSKLDTKCVKRYASIINPINMFINGFNKVFNYSVLKKLLLIGFFVAGMFITYSVSSYLASIKVYEEDFITVDRNYLKVDGTKVKLDEYLNIEKNENVLYVIPGNSLVSASISVMDFYQTKGNDLPITVSLVCNDAIVEDDIIDGSKNESKNEVVIDKLAIDRAIKSDSTYKMVGVLSYEDVVNRILKIGDKEYKIVGITDTGSPNMYVLKSELLPIVSITNKEKSKVNDDSTNISSLKSYEENKDKLEIKKGKAPSGEYEIIVPLDYQDIMPLNKDSSYKINNKKLKVVGYYTSKFDLQDIFSSDVTIKYLTVISSKSYSIMPGDKDLVYNELRDKNINVIDKYMKDKNEYLKEKNFRNGSTIIISIIILGISFIEIFLMVRSSFLSRIKEVGIYRAIGVKRLDICKMFAGEIFAITTLSSLPGLTFMSYILKEISKMDGMNYYVILDIRVIVLSLIIIYSFNTVMGLLPVIGTIRKRPAEILARYDLD